MTIRAAHEQVRCDDSSCSTEPPLKEALAIGPLDPRPTSEEPAADEVDGWFAHLPCTD